MRKAIPSVFAALLGFVALGGLSLENDRFLSERFIRGALAPLAISVKTGDDLMALDWARRFEVLDGVEAFQAVCGGKKIASGGRSDLLSSAPGPDFEWLPPMRYRLRLDEEPLPRQHLGLEIILRASPGPLGWGFLGSLLGLSGVWLQSFLGRRPCREEKKHETPSPQHLSPDFQKRDLSFPMNRAPSRIGLEPNPLTSGVHRGCVPPMSSPQFGSQSPSLVGQTNSKPSLRLDAKWTVQGFSEDLPSYLGIPPEELMGRHLMQLDPHPTLLTLLEKSQKGSTSQGFNRLPSCEIEVFPLEDKGVLLVYVERPSSPISP